MHNSLITPSICMIMTKLIWLLSFSILISCTADAQWKSIKGTGPLTKETRNVSGFDAVSNTVSADVELHVGSTFHMEIEGQANILSLLETTVSGKTLNIQFKKNTNVSYNTPLKISITAPAYEGIELSGSGNITADELSGNNLKLDLSGSGNIIIKSAKYASVAAGLSGSGDITIKGGSSDSVKFEIDGSGNVEALNLSAKDAICEISGSGDIYCTATSSLKANIDGSGNVEYKGSPSVKSNISGSGDVVQKG